MGRQLAIWKFPCVHHYSLCRRGEEVQLHWFLTWVWVVIIMPQSL